MVMDFDFKSETFEVEVPDLLYDEKKKSSFVKLRNLLEQRCDTCTVPRSQCSLCLIDKSIEEIRPICTALHQKKYMTKSYTYPGSEKLKYHEFIWIDPDSNKLLLDILYQECGKCDRTTDVDNCYGCLINYLKPFIKSTTVLRNRDKKHYETLDQYADVFDYMKINRKE